MRWRASLTMLLAVCGLTLAVALPVSAATYTCAGSTMSPYPEVVPNDFDHARYAPTGRLGIPKVFTAYVSVFDDIDDDDGDGLPDLRANPEFVMYELRGVGAGQDGVHEEPNVSIVRPRKWYSAPEHAFLWSKPGISARRIDDSYNYGAAGSPWDRGHLAMSDHAQRIGPEAACNTHQFWNASPQAEELNQGPWLNLEVYTASAANKYGKVWIIVGPIFDPATPKLSIGDSGEVPVEIPDAFFKVVVREEPGGVIDALAFVYEQPNALQGGKPVPTSHWTKCSSSGVHYDHAAQLVAISEIERRTGLTFFGDRSDRQQLISAKAPNLWPVEQRFWDPHSPCGYAKTH